MRKMTTEETKLIIGGTTYSCNGNPKLGIGSLEKCYYSTTSLAKYTAHYFTYHYIAR